jgi:cytochrome c oxidase subunit II
MSKRKWLVSVALIAGLSITAIGWRNAIASTQPRVVTITAAKFQFSPNEIDLNKGEPVVIELTSKDTTHGFMVRPLKIDTDIKPGRMTRIEVTPQSAGTFKAICDHYCGLGHGNMKLTIVVK